jgi:hypothetical protein
MADERLSDRTGEADSVVTAQFEDETPSSVVSAWEEVASGRYMPRRIRGSCRGRALG